MTDVYVGVIQIFKHRDALKHVPKEFENIVWVPVGEVKGEHGWQQLGQRVVLSGNGTVLIATSTNDIRSDPMSAYVLLFDDDDKYLSNEWKSSWNYLGQVKLQDKVEHQVVMSADALTWVVSEPNYDMPGGRRSAGRVQIFRLEPSIERDSLFGNTLGTLVQEADLFGSEESEWFGGSLSISSNGDFLVVGSKFVGIRTFRRDNRRQWKSYGGLFGKAVQQRKCCFDRDAFGTDVAISSNGTRVAGGASWRRSRFEGTLGTGDVGVWDY